MEEEKKKTCTKCKGEFPATSEYFHRNRTAPDGLEFWCKECKKKKSVDYRLKKVARQTFKEVMKRPRLGTPPMTTVDGQRSKNMGSVPGQLTGATPTEIIVALRKGMAQEIVKMIQEKFEL